MANYPGNITTASPTPYDDEPWFNPTGVAASGGTYTSSSEATYDINDWTHQLITYNYGFAPTASVVGIEVEINAYNGAVNPHSPGLVSLTKAGSVGTLTGSNKGSASAWVTSPGETKTFGGPTELWNTTWTMEEVAASTFGVVFANQANGNNCDVFVDFIRTTVYYQSAVTGNPKAQMYYTKARQ